jgi:hypothetical protein
MVECPAEVMGVQLNGGQRLRALRETLGYRMRDVELASNQIAQRFASEEFAIPPSRLSDIETKGIIPSIFLSRASQPTLALAARQSLTFPKPRAT